MPFRKNISMVNCHYYGVTAKVMNGIPVSLLCPHCGKYKTWKSCSEIIAKYLGPPSKNPTGLEHDIYRPQYHNTHNMEYKENSMKNTQNSFIKIRIILSSNKLMKELCEEDWIDLRYVWSYVVIPEHLRELGLIK